MRAASGRSCTVRYVIGLMVVLAGLLGWIGLPAAGATATTSQLQITTSTLPVGTLHARYTAQLTASGGSPPYRFWLASGALPKGMHVRHWMGSRPQKTTGELVGRPRATGTWTFTIKVIDHRKDSAAQTFTLVVTS